MKKNRKYKRTLREDLRMIVRGYKLVWQMSHMNVIWRMAYVTSMQITPYLTLYMSALLIDELTAGASAERLLTLAVITVVGTFAANMLCQHVVGRQAVKYENIQWQRDEKFMTDVEARMQYCHLETPETSLVREQITHSKNYGGNGLMTLYWSIWFITEAIINIVASVALTASMLTMSANGTFKGFLAFANSPWSALMIVAIIIVNILFQVRTSARKKVLLDQNWNKYSAERKRGWHLLNWGTEDVYQMGMKDFLLRRTREHFIKPKVYENSFKIQWRYNSISTVWNALMNIALFIYVGARAYIGVFGIGSFILYRGTVERFINAVSTLGARLGELRNNNDFLQKIFDYVDLPNAMYQGTLSVEKRNDNRFEIEFRNVSFKYPGSESYALKNVNFKFRIGERLAFVGMNGSGKTTFIKLLCRLYDPTEGEILLNGIDITRYEYHEYLDLFSVVFQDFATFAYTIADNVSGEKHPNREKIMESLTRAGLGEKISRLPKGIDTYIYRWFSNDGVDLSRGELQKVALARALYKGAPFFILDEPTAALDPIAEAEVYSRFGDVVGDKTAIFISHRLSSCRFCDKIAVFHEGELIQYGSHDDLAAVTDGKYYELWHAQAQYYT